MDWTVRSRAHLTSLVFVISSAAANGLIPVRVASWESFIFVNLNQEGPGLGSYLGELWERISVGGLRFFARKSYTLACNWKVYVDNYLDGGYHVPHLHKALNSVLDYSEYTLRMVRIMCFSRALWWRRKMRPWRRRVLVVGRIITGSILIS